MKFTKIVATIGPKTCTPAKLKSLYKAGMDIARLNGSHNSLEWHKKIIKIIREQLPMVPILLDIPGKRLEQRISKLNRHSIPTIKLFLPVMIIIRELIRFNYK